MPEFINHAKQANPPLKYATVGAGALQHLSMEFAKQRFGFDAIHVPYRQTGQSVTDLAAGHVDVGFVEAGASIPLIKEGRLRALAVSASQRLPLLPDVPPFSEAASAPDFEAVSWHILLAPAKTPKDIVDRLHAEMKKIMAEPGMKEKASNIGLIPIDTPRSRHERLHEVGARQMGLAGGEARPEGVAIALPCQNLFQSQDDFKTGGACHWRGLHRPRLGQRPRHRP